MPLSIDIFCDVEGGAWQCLVGNIPSYMLRRWLFVRWMPADSEKL